jgi:uncharacterized protein YciI
MCPDSGEVQTVRRQIMDSMEMTPREPSAEAPENGGMGSSLFAVIREGGARWDYSRPASEQDAWDEHLAFMGGLVESRFVVLGGWLADAPKTLLVVEADDEADVRRRFEDDPYTAMEMLAITSVDPWEVLLGRELLAAA